MNSKIYTCIFVSMCFAMWPLLANRFLGSNLQLGTIIIMAATVLPISIGYFFFNNSTDTVMASLTTTQIIAAIGIGLLNGMGMLFYFYLNKSASPGLYISIVAILMPIFALIFGRLINGLPEITYTKIIGIICGVLCVYFLTKKWNQLNYSVKIN